MQAATDGVHGGGRAQKGEIEGKGRTETAGEWNEKGTVEDQTIHWRGRSRSEEFGAAQALIARSGATTRRKTKPDTRDPAARDTREKERESWRRSVGPRSSERGERGRKKPAPTGGACKSETQREGRGSGREGERSWAEFQGCRPEKN